MAKIIDPFLMNIFEKKMSSAIGNDNTNAIIAAIKREKYLVSELLSVANTPRKGMHRFIAILSSSGPFSINFDFACLNPIKSSKFNLFPIFK